MYTVYISIRKPVAEVKGVAHHQPGMPHMRARSLQYIYGSGQPYVCGCGCGCGGEG